MEASNEQPKQTPEGAIIETHQRQKGLSSRKAAELAGMSDARWRQIVNGYQSIAKGLKAPVVGPPETIARMAKVVGAHYSEFEPIRTDVFNIMFDEFVEEAKARGDIPSDEAMEKITENYEHDHSTAQLDLAAMYVRGDIGGEDHRDDLLDVLGNDDIVDAVRKRIQSLTAEVKRLRAEVSHLRENLDNTKLAAGPDDEE